MRARVRRRRRCGCRRGRRGILHAVANIVDARDNSGLVREATSVVPAADGQSVDLVLLVTAAEPVVGVAAGFLGTTSQAVVSTSGDVVDLSSTPAGGLGNSRGRGSRGSGADRAGVFLNTVADVVHAGQNSVLVRDRARSEVAAQGLSVDANGVLAAAGPVGGITA